jgi:ribosomal protein L11 methyltransferase
MISDPFDGAVWRVILEVPKHVAEGFADALESRFPAVSWFEPEKGASMVRLEAYSGREIDVDDLNRWLSEIADGFGVTPPVADVIWLPTRDWVAENRRAFDPFSIGRFFVHGAEHRRVVPVGKTGIEVEAGLAFGSGRHESTAGCLTALDGLVRRRFARPLDMGCGSGILSIAMAKSWRVPVIAADIDETAVRVARANAWRNGVGKLIRTISGNGYAAPGLSVSRPHDLIVANILADPLCAMARQLARQLAPGGVAVLAGFVAADEARVFAAHRSHGVRLLQRIDIGGWRTLVLKKAFRLVNETRPARPDKSRPE